MSPARGALRLGRAAVLGAACLLLSLTGHVLAGGSAPSLLALLVISVPVACGCVLVTGRQAGLLRIGTVLAVTQVALHDAFSLTSHCGAVTATMGSHAHSGHGPLTACGGAMPMGGGSLTMFAAHALAAVAAGLLLWHGERLLWTFVRWLTRARPARPALTIALVGFRQPPAVRRVRASVARLGGVGRRGPPARSAA